MKTSAVITIGRQYGSSGRQIGQEVAKIFGIECYDKVLLEFASKDSGICRELFENNDERPTKSLLYSIVMDTYSFGYSSAAFTDMPINHKVFLAQFESIKKLAEKGPCVMVGRCADYALADLKNAFHVFIHGNIENRIQNIAQKYDLSESAAKDRIQKTDKSRASYYNYYTNKKWGEAASYDLCVDSSKFGIDGTVQIIADALRIFEKTL